MTLEKLFQDKTLKAKAKVAQIGDLLLSGKLPVDDLLTFTIKRSGAHKATCIEALEYATKKNPNIADESLLTFIAATLNDDEPRIKWESAKVIGNIAKLFPTQVVKCTDNLLKNAAHDGTVVRWATAYALAQILKLKMDVNKKLLPELEVLCQNEEDNGVKKKYLDAIKRVRT